MVEDEGGNNARKTSDAFRDAFVAEFLPGMKKCNRWSFLDDLWNTNTVKTPEGHQFAEMCELQGVLPGGVFPEGVPFLLHNRGFLIANTDLPRVLPWLMANRPLNGLLKIFIHPNTGCQFNDLYHWSMLVGESVDMNMRATYGCVWAGCEDKAKGCITGGNSGRNTDPDPTDYGQCYQAPAQMNVKCTTSLESNTTMMICQP